jgi:adenosylhomocysteine nucleosidase
LKIGVIAALPSELKPLVKGWERLPVVRGSGVRMWQTELAGNEVLAVCAGMGAAAARRAFAAAEFTGAMDAVFSVGLAGALTVETLPGQSYVASSVVDAQTGERYELGDGGRRMILVTTAGVAAGEEKRRLAAAYSATLVDMETATVLRLARMRGIPACCVKAVSDELGETLPDFGRFTDHLGQLRMAPFLSHVSVRPNYWGPLMRLGRNSAKGAKTLASAVLTILTGPMDLAEVNRTGNVDW